MLLSTVIIGHAALRKEYKNLKTYIKTANYGKGREQIAKGLADSTLNNDPYFYELAIALETKANDAENMKLYLKQNYDTASFFNTGSKIVEYSLLQDSLQAIENPATIAAKRKKKVAKLIPHYQNLYNGGIFFVKRKQWGDADRMFSMYIDASTNPMFQGVAVSNLSKLSRAAFWSMSACFETQRYGDVFKYHDLAEADTANLNYVLQYEALSYVQLKDTANFVGKLKEGIACNLSSEFFVSRLSDHYNAIHDYRSAYQLSDSLVRADSTSALFRYVRTIALFNLKDYDKCIDNTLRLLNIDSTNIEANYYLGLCWYNKGLDLDATILPDPTSVKYKESKQVVHQMFERAMPYLEKFRIARPDDKERWQAPLYRIYFSLNLSDKLKSLEQ